MKIRILGPSLGIQTQSVTNPMFYKPCTTQAYCFASLQNILEALQHFVPFTYDFHTFLTRFCICQYMWHMYPWIYMFILYCLRIIQFRHGDLFLNNLYGICQNAENLSFGDVLSNFCGPGKRLLSMNLWFMALELSNRLPGRV